MSTPVTALAVDLGSSSGRILAGTLAGGALDVREIHRFTHRADERGGRLVWQLDHIAEQVVAGLRQAVALVDNPVSVSVDTWGVDFVALDADGNLVGEPRTYRDERTTRTQQQFRARFGDREFFAATGVAPATINTANQLFALGLEQPDLTASIHTVLLLPDYFTWLLTQRPCWSPSIASTSGLCQPGARRWSPEVFDALGLNRAWVGDLTDELSVAGRCTLDGLEMLQVVRAGAHDTACAVTSLPARDEPSFFLSCGSWSVLGLTTDTPLLSDDAFASGLTNEVCADGRIRALLNITGLWTLQECQRDWAASGDEHRTGELLSAADAAPTLGVTFDVDDPRLMVPGHMVQRVRDLLAERGASRVDQGQLVRAVLESLAERYARGVAELSRASGVKPERLVVVGGGARNDLLLDLTAAATGLPVVRGPVEASALGSLLGQFRALGMIGVAESQTLISDSVV